MFSKMKKLSTRFINNSPMVLELVNKYNGLVTLQCLLKMKTVFTKDTNFDIYNFDVIIDINLLICLYTRVFTKGDVDSFLMLSEKRSEERAMPCS